MNPGNTQIQLMGFWSNKDPPYNPICYVYFSFLSVNKSLPAGIIGVAENKKTVAGRLCFYNDFLFFIADDRCRAGS